MSEAGEARYSTAMATSSGWRSVRRELGTTTGRPRLDRPRPVDQFGHHHRWQMRLLCTPCHLVVSSGSPSGVDVETGLVLGADCRCTGVSAQPAVLHGTVAEGGVARMSRPGARCRDCSRSVSPDRSPNPACMSPRTGLSTGTAAYAGVSAQGVGMLFARHR